MSEEPNYKDSLSEIQTEVDEKRREIKEQLGDEKLEKHVVVERVLGELAQHKIKAYIYADLPNVGVPDGIPSIIQYNTIVNLIDYDEKGEPTEKSVEEISFFTEALYTGLFHTITMQSMYAKRLGLDTLDPKDPETLKKRFDHFAQFIYTCLSEYTRKIDEKMDEQ